MTEPNPCPHCGAEAVLAAGYRFLERKEGGEVVTKAWNWVRYKDCGAIGGIGKTAIEAVEKWNRRVAKDEGHHVQESAGLVSGNGGVREGEGAAGH